MTSRNLLLDPCALILPIMPLPSLPVGAALLDIPLGGREVCQNITDAEEAGAGEYLPHPGPRNAEIRTAVRKIAAATISTCADLSAAFCRKSGSIMRRCKALLDATSMSISVREPLMFVGKIGLVETHDKLRVNCGRPENPDVELSMPSDNTPNR